MAGPSEVRMLPAGERGLVVEMGNLIDPTVNARVQRLAKHLSQRNIEGVIEVVPTYRSLFVCFDPLTISRSQLIETIHQMIQSVAGPDAAEREGVRVVHVPVAYGGEFGPDLDYVGQHNGLSVEEVITVPRLEKPRAKIPRGSVGIAGAQTGLYPVESPGGWRLIGRPPLNPFVPGAANPFLFAAGDYLRFLPISVEEYHHIRKEVEAGLFTPEIRTVSTEAISHDQDD